MIKAALFSAQTLRCPLSSDGLGRLRGRRRNDDTTGAAFSPFEGDPDEDDASAFFDGKETPAGHADERIERELAAIRLADTAMAKSERVLSGIARPAAERDPLIYDPDWDEEKDLAL